MALNHRVLAFPWHADSRLKAARTSGFDFGRLDRNLAYFFELCHPATTVVIAHPRPRLVHLGARDSVTFREVPDADVGVERPQLFPLGSGQACAAAALALGPESEGYGNFDISLHHFSRSTPPLAGAV